MRALFAAVCCAPLLSGCFFIFIPGVVGDLHGGRKSRIWACSQK